MTYFLESKMNTQLIYTNKESAVVKNDINGDWINETPSIIVKAGDYVSVEAIAVSTDGTGADIIEIPRQIKDYDYATNQMALEFMVYIHQNYQYTCMMPLTISGTDGDIFTTQTDLNYGDFKADVFNIIHNKFYRAKNGIPTDWNAGSRMYIGTFGDENNLDIYDPMKSTTFEDPLLSTGNKVFSFMTTTIPVEVDYGYNTPQNIASKITFDLQSAMKTPNRSNYDTLIENEVEPNKAFQVGPPPPLDVKLQTTATNSQGAVITINGLPNQYFGKTASGSNPYWYATYSNWLAVAFPFYWYYGSRLQARSPNGTAKANNWAIANLAGNITQADILNLAQLRNNGVDTTIQTGDVIPTNIPFTPENMEKVSKLIYHMKRYEGATTHLLSKTQEQMIEDKNEFYTYLPLGKYDDGQNTPWTSNSKLESKVLSLADTCSPDYFKVKTFYQGESYVLDDAVGEPNYPASLGLIGVFYKFLNFGDKNTLQICQEYDINVRAVQGLVGGALEFTIGLVMEAKTLSGNLIRAGNFCLVDLTFTRPEASASMILCPDIYDGQSGNIPEDLVKAMNVGAPNIELSFNNDRSRFSWRSMYWANYIQNPTTGTDANPAAGQEVFTSNKNIPTGGDYYTPVTAELANVIFDKYAQSGLGFYKLYVKTADNIFVAIDEDDQNDISSKYEGSLLHRIGFEYEDIINTWGLPNVFYQERMMKNQLKHKYPQYFPYPLTCNVHIDTGINISLSQTNQNLPMFDLSTQRNTIDLNISASTAEILSRNKPTKLATPFWLIEADILPALKYYVEGNPRNIMAVCNRAYGSGDFVFSFSTDYKFIATKDFVITQIKQNVLTGDLLPADIEDNTTIIYKIESPILPNFVSAQQAMEEEEEALKKGKR